LTWARGEEDREREERRGEEERGGVGREWVT